MNRNKIIALNLQKFAAETDLTGKAQINVAAREIDFVTSFAKNLKALTDVLGISRMIKKANGSVLKTKKVTGTLKTAAVAEGDVIPNSQYTVTETPYETITIEKFRKSVSAEAIAEKGYASAVQLTDDEFKSDLQYNVMDKFYAQIKKGSLTGSYAGFQKAFAMSIGKVKDKFKKMHRTATGIVVIVNTLDLYNYLGDTQITVQQAFGLDYVEKFMGADVVLISSEIAEGKIYATALNNLIGYYVDPADSEFAAAGLTYRTDPETGIIGFHTEGNYSRATSEAYALMGIRVFAEYLDAVAAITVTAITVTAGE